MSLNSKVCGTRFVQGYEQTASPRSIHSAHKSKKDQKKQMSPKKAVKQLSPALKSKSNRSYMDHNITISKEELIDDQKY